MGSPPAEIPTRRDRRRARSEGAILDAAERLLAQRGYRGTTIEALAEAADVAIGTIYARFGGKHGVYVALAERAVARNREYVDAALAQAATPLEAVVALAESYERYHLDNPLAFRVIGLVDLDDTSADDRARIQRPLEAMLGELADRLAAAMQAGDLRTEDPLRVARVLWASANGILALHARGGLPAKELPRALALNRELHLAGLRA